MFSFFFAHCITFLCVRLSDILFCACAEVSRCCSLGRLDDEDFCSGEVAEALRRPGERDALLLAGDRDLLRDGDRRLGERERARLNADSLYRKKIQISFSIMNISDGITQGLSIGEPVCSCGLPSNNN